MENKHCAHCGTSFYGASNKMYCSNACKQHAFREKHQHTPEDDTDFSVPKTDVIWFMELCLDYQFGKRLPKTDLQQAYERLETILEPFYDRKEYLQEPFEWTSSYSDDLPALLINVWCLRDALKKNLEGEIGRNWLTNQGEAHHLLDLDELNVSGMVSDTFKVIKTYLN